MIVTSISALGRRRRAPAEAFAAGQVRLSHADRAGGFDT
jgi:hypothetical protein